MPPAEMAASVGAAETLKQEKQESEDESKAEPDRAKTPRDLIWDCFVQVGISVTYKIKDEPRPASNDKIQYFQSPKTFHLD